MSIGEGAVGETERLGEALEKSCKVNTTDVVIHQKDVAVSGAGREEDCDDAQVLEALEDFFSAPEFTGYVRKFVEENIGIFFFVEEGEEQPLCNYDLYMKYTKIIEEQLDDFLQKQGLSHEDIAALCVQERGDGNNPNYCLDYIIASTQYDAFIKMMLDMRDMTEYLFDEDDFAGYSCLGCLEPLEGEGLEGVGEDDEAEGEGACP